MHKHIIMLSIALLLCSCAKAPALTDNAFSPSAPPTAEMETPSPLYEDCTPAPSGAGLFHSLEEQMAFISFTQVSGQYVRKSIQGDTEYMEMFALDKSSFVRAALNESEEEVFVYDYQNDRFTYMYLFENELLSKVVYEIGSRTVLEDADDLSGLLINDAEDLKEYFYVLLDTAGVGVEDLR